MTEFFSLIALFSVEWYSTRCNPYRESAGVFASVISIDSKTIPWKPVAGWVTIYQLVNNFSFLSLNVWMNAAYGFLWAHSSLPKQLIWRENIFVLVLWKLVEAYEMLTENIKSDIWGSWLCCAEESIQNFFCFWHEKTMKENILP